MSDAANDFSRLELNLPNCLDNYRYFRSKLRRSTRLLVLVKANAYGHGAVEFALMMQNAGADYLAVALPVEGIELRRSGISLPILVLTAGTDFSDEIIDNRLEPGIPNLYTLKSFAGALQARGIEDYPIHIKLDTGMHRLGFMTSEIGPLVEFLRSCPAVKVKSVYSHLSVAEDPAMDAFTLAQVEMFDKLKPVASLKVKVLQVKELKDGDGAIGYGRKGIISPGGTTLATIPVGYADGIDRRLGCGRASFSLNGRRVPTVGNICMDMCMLDVTGVDCKAGDTVTIFGEDPSVEELARILGTIPYEIMTSVPRRIERVIVRR